MSLDNRALQTARPERNFIDPVDVTYQEPVGDLWEIGKDMPHLGKWFHYYEIYEELLEKYRGKSPKILEIGVYYGDSLRMWKEYFGEGTVVVGIDILKACMESDDPDNGVHVRLVDQANHEGLKGVIEEFGQFDIIIDDGCHFTQEQYMSFVCLFREGLVDNGLYIVEDMHSNMWSEFKNSKVTFAATCHQLVDLMYAAYTKSVKPEDYYDSDEANKTCKMEYYEAWVHSIQFFDSIVAFHRKLRPAPVNPDLQFRNDFELDIQLGEKITD